MVSSILKNLKTLSHSLWYWLALMLFGIGLLAVALFYQYVLDELPCLLCIQIRMWVLLLVVIAFIGLLVRRNQLLNSAAQLSVALVALGFVERSYLLLGTERGFVEGDCGFDLGLPAWLALEEWLPSVFYVHRACGYTPEIVFGITMAEALMLLSVTLLLVSAVIALASFLRRGH